MKIILSFLKNFRALKKGETVYNTLMFPLEKRKINYIYPQLSLSPKLDHQPNFSWQINLCINLETNFY